MFKCITTAAVVTTTTSTTTTRLLLFFKFLYPGCKDPGGLKLIIILKIHFNF